MSNLAPQDSAERRPRHHWEYLLLLLVLPLSFSCVFCSATVALWYWPEKLAPASLLSQRRADYRGGPGGPVFPVMRAGAETSLATQIALLQITPAQPGRPVSMAVLQPAPQPATTPGPSDNRPGDFTSPNAPANPTSPSLQTATPPPTVTPWPTASPLASATLPPLPTVTPLPTTTPLPTLTPIPPASTATATPTPTFTPTPPPDHNDGGNGGHERPATATPRPLAAFDDAFTTLEDQVAVFEVLANDDPGADALRPGSVLIVTAPLRGATAVEPISGQVIYTPTLNFFGSDGFDYRVCGLSGVCATASVAVAVTALNDPPLAVADEAWTAEDTAEVIEVLLNDLDVDNDPLTVTLVTGPAHGLASTDGRLVSYQPDPDFSGQDTVNYTVSDGELTGTATLSITIVAVNDPPLAQPDSYANNPSTTLTVPAPGVLANDTDPDPGDTLRAVVVSNPLSGTLSLSPDGALIYEPVPAFSGVVTFSYRAEDTIAFRSNEVTVTINIP